jgi:hypothetical protein
MKNNIFSQFVFVTTFCVFLLWVLLKVLIQNEILAYISTQALLVGGLMVVVGPSIWRWKMLCNPLLAFAVFGSLSYLFYSDVNIFVGICAVGTVAYSLFAIHDVFTAASIASPGDRFATRHMMRSIASADKRKPAKDSLSVDDTANLHAPEGFLQSGDADTLDPMDVIANAQAAAELNQRKHDGSE